MLLGVLHYKRCQNLSDCYITFEDVFLDVNGRLGFDFWAVIGLRIIETKICFSHTQTS